MSRINLYFLGVLLTLVFLSNGCSMQLSKSNETPSSLRSPVPTSTVESILWNIITPEPGKAILRGRVIVQPNFLLGELYLGKAVPTSDPRIELIELEEKASPRAIINRATGDFIFLNVNPGKYGLIAWEPMRSMPVNDPKTGSTLFITLHAGQIVDIGTLFIP